jgi:uncharacterized protein
MDDKIVDFIALLRSNGLRTSMSEDLDAFAAVQRMGLGDRRLLKDVLRATLVKSTLDVAVFDELFDLYFGGLGDTMKAVESAARQAMQVDEGGYQDLLDALAEILEQMDVDLSDLARQLLNNDTGQLEKMLREAAREADLRNIERSFQEGRYGHSIAQILGIGGLAQELDSLKDKLGDLDPELQEKLAKLLDQRLQDLTSMIKRMVRLELQKRDQTLRENQRARSLEEKSFYYLSEDEVRQMKEAVAKLAQRLKNVVAIRRRKGKRGKFDVKATLRRNLQYGGVPFRIQFDRRVKDRPQVIVLCDVSDSVRNVSRFMLQFVYSLQDLYSRVRSFIFVNDIGEVTQMFEDYEIGEALDQALGGGVINVYAHSDFGRAFCTFHRDYLDAINKRTTVIILGDARNNYNAPHEWVLRDVKLRAKQVIWLNPENRLTWGFGDSEMDRYLPHCDVVEECRNLKQLYAVVDRMVH